MFDTKDIEVLTQRDISRAGGRIMIRFDDFQLASLSKMMFESALREAARELGKRIADEMFQEIVANIDPKALANMSIAEAGAEIHALLQKKLPDRVDRIVERQTEVY